jgi:muconate cycloisomerase
VLARPIDQNRVTLRVDANGAWSLAEAHDALALLENCGVCALEQPLSESHDDDLPYLAEQTRCDLVVDESLLTLEDAQRLIAAGGVRVFNIRIAKNGGLLPALRIARLALTAGLDVQLGCLVGETSLLAAAGVAFLEACPKARFVEGAYAPYLLHQDITRHPVRFRRGGRMFPRSGPGLDVNVDAARLQSLSVAPPRSISY